MKAPYAAPLTMICAECGSVMLQADRIKVEPVPHVETKCLAGHCAQKDVVFAIRLPQVELHA